jgi:hypothetical protein
MSIKKYASIQSIDVALGDFNFKFVLDYQKDSNGEW